MHYLKVVGFVFIGVLILSFGQSLAQATWGTERLSGKNIWASRRDSAGVAPDPAALRDTAIVQVYTAPTYGWRGLVAVHPWIIVKQAGETRYQRYEVIGWGGDDVI
ncbi:DUF3750 domain-containing protein, partial [Dickeya fangzhongdai]